MFVILKKKFLIIALVLAFVTVACCSTLNATASADVFFNRSNRKLPVYAVDTDEKVVALSFDAAWGADKTEKIMEILKSYDATATFFLVGFWVDKYPETTKKIYENGFEIGTHSSAHLHMSKLSEEEMKQDLSMSIDKIQSLTGATVRVFRPPYGEYNDTLITVSKSLNVLPVQWSVDSLDWKGISAKEISSRILSRVNDGSIILCHNNSDHIVEALPVVLSGLIAKGYKFKAVGDLVMYENYYIDNNGVQHSDIDGETKIEYTL